MVMLSSGGGHQGEFAELVRPPIDRDAIRAQSIYIVVRNIDDHYAHAVAGGAEIVMGNQRSGVRRAEAILVVTRKVTSGALAPMIHG